MSTSSLAPQSSTMLLVASTLLLLCFTGSWGGVPEDPELMQRSLAAANLRHFPEKLLQDALFPDHDPRKPVSREALLRLLESPEGQEAVRGAALQAMLAQSPGVARGRDGEVGWLGGMCDSMPWLAWLGACTAAEDVTKEPVASERQPATQQPPPFVITLDKFEWATCPDEL